MSSTADDAAESLRLQYEALSQEAATLSMTLARRRADIALMRAEAATVAVSLESAKEDLDDLLRKEVAIGTHVPESPDEAQEDSVDFHPDQGLIRALSGQLEVTIASVRSGLSRKLSMEAEIDRLEKLIESKGASADDSGELPRANSGKLDGILELRLNSISEDAEASHDGKATVGEKGRSPMTSLEENMLMALKEGTESKSSFRFDHARIWRDITMPNLALVRKPVGDNSQDAEVSLGVIIERIFEGITCFSPTSAAEQGKRSSAKDLRIESSGPVRETDKETAELVAKHFGTLTANVQGDSKPVTIVAPKVALDRVMELISDETDIPKRPTPQLHVQTSDELIPEEIRLEPAGSRPASGGRKSSRRHHRAHDVPESEVFIKLSDPSHVLHVDHIRQIMSHGVPVRFHESGLQLVYSTNLHGMSLHTLFNRVKTTSPTLVAIRDTKERVFGCYVASPWKSSSPRYYGTGESFVFGTDGQESAKVFKWSRENSFFQFTSNTFLALGGGAGSHFALWVDEDLLMGTTSACRTFASPPLTNIKDDDPSSCAEFKIVSLEVWGFNAHITP